MAELSKSGRPSIATPTPCPAHTIASGIVAGEAIGAGDACYIKASDGKAYKATGAAANEAAKVAGFAAKAAALGGAVTLYADVQFHDGSGMTPGTRFFLSASVAGGLADAATTGGTGPIARAVDNTRLRVWDAKY
jgi:hypothetical protein